MRRFVLALGLIFALPGLGFGQETPAEQADKSTLELWIQDQLSGLGRRVDVTGFSGALSAQAHVDRITVADDTGIWLDIADITLDWSQSAIFSGRIEINEFRAGEISLLRPPVAAQSTPSPEATPFALPDLPVSIEIGNLSVDRIALGSGFLGDPLAAKVAGRLSLIAGEGSAVVTAERIDGAEGLFEIDASYSNATDILGLDLVLTEGPGGVVARLIDLPDQPPLSFRVTGKGPLDNYAADIRLNTDGIERLAGSVTVTDIPANPDTAQMGSRRAVLDIGGDITALFLPTYRDFFGPAVQLRTVATLSDDGSYALDDLTLQTRALRVEGDARFDAAGLPQRFDLTGNLADPLGRPVILPLNGAPIRVSTASLGLSYDADVGDRWKATLFATGFDRDGVSIPDLQLAGDGSITTQATGDGSVANAFSGALVYVADGITFASSGLARAIGPRVSGQFRFHGQSGDPFSVDRLTIKGPGLSIDGSARIEGLDQGFRTQTDMKLTAEDFARFDQLTGLPLGGRGDVRIAGFYGPLDGMLSGRIDGATVDLETGVSQLDPLLRGAALIGMQLDRDAQGARVTGLKLQSGSARIDADLDLSSGAKSARVDAALTNIGLSVPGLSGPATLGLTAAQTDAGQGTLDGFLALNNDRIDLAARQQTAGLDQPAQITLTAALRDLRQWSGLVGRPLAGQVEARATGTARPDAEEFDLAVSAATSGLRTGADAIDKLVAGSATARMTLRRPTRGGIEVEGLTLNAPNLSLTGDLTGQDGAGRANFDARIRDINVFAPDFSGALAATGQAIRGANGDWTLSTTAQGPGGTTAEVSGRIASNGQLALSARGQAPLGFLNGAIAPRRLAGMAGFDLALNGTARLDAVSGTITTQNAALSAPTVGSSVEDVAGTVRFAGGQAVLDLSGRFSRGGTVQVSGPVGLVFPNQGDLAARIDGLVLRDPTLYETTLSGDLTMSGPLAGGAAIRGQMELGRTEIQVPSTGIGALGDLPSVTHVGASAAVLQTLQRADATATGNTAAGPSAGGSSYPIDIVINAPARVFVRGRGLDAELGGSLTLGGTTANIQPRGQLDLVRGRLDILQQRFNLTEGTATLQGDFEPYIKLLATTTAPTGTLVTIAVEGPASAPAITFSSSPELPQDEVLAQLIFGRDLQSITPLQALQLAAAVGTLAGKGGGGIAATFRDGIGLDDFDVITDQDGNAAVRAGKYLSENVYADVTLGSNGTSEINLNLDVTDTLTARGSFGNDGETSVGIFFEKDY